MDLSFVKQIRFIHHNDKFQFREEIFMRTKHVIVEDYNLEWKNEFKRIKMNYLSK